MEPTTDEEAVDAADEDPSGLRGASGPLGDDAADGGDGAGDGEAVAAEDRAAAEDPGGPGEPGDPFVPLDVGPVDDPSEPGEPAAAGSPEEERDLYRDALMRVKADFENYKKRQAKDHALTVAQAARSLVDQLLPVLDACESAVAHGAPDVEPIHQNLLAVLEKEGLETLSPTGDPFDPNLHEAVLREESDGDEMVVVETLRTGYVWKGALLRAAMVKVKG